MIADGATEQQIEAHAFVDNALLANSGRALVAAGETTTAEVLRVARPERNNPVMPAYQYVAVDEKGKTRKGVGGGKLGRSTTQFARANAVSAQS